METIARRAFAGLNFRFFVRSFWLRVNRWVGASLSCAYKSAEAAIRMSSPEGCRVAAAEFEFLTSRVDELNARLALGQWRVREPADGFSYFESESGLESPLLDVGLLGTMKSAQLVWCKWAQSISCPAFSQGFGDGGQS